MAKTVYIDGRACRLSPNKVIGQGGEAVVYQYDPTTALKVYLEPDDPLYHGNPIAQAGARNRLDEQQFKLPAFPTTLPAQVIAPDKLAYDRQTRGRISGYTMPLLKDMEVLLSFSDRKYREQRGIDSNQVVVIFQGLHQLVQQIHDAHLVIGDFNDLNVLVNNHQQPFLVDADSMQFGPFQCRTFTTRFVDPLRCYPDKLMLAAPHTMDSDWYAFTTMLFQCLLYINPFFGGVHKPKGSSAYRNDARVLHRVSVFSADVIYPKVAVPLSALPDELLEHFQSAYDQDKRGVFPLELIEDLRWTHCTSCGIWHAREVCPACAAPGVVKQTITIRGTVKATTLLKTTGRVLAVAYQGGTLRWLHHEHGAYQRENGQTVLRGPLDGTLRIRLWGDKTVLGKGSTLVTLGTDRPQERLTTDLLGQLPMFDANERHLYWLDHGRLVHDGQLKPVDIGTVLSNQTLFWTGNRFGFGFYRAGSLTRGFVFDAERPGINDSVPLPPIPGTLIDATCVFADKLAWFMLSLQDNGVIKHFCFVISHKAELVATHEADRGDGSWLGDGIRGRLAIGQNLYAATDTGIVRVAISGNHLRVDRQFPDTEPFVDSLTLLLPGKDGICAVSAHEITLLQIQ